MLSHMPWDFVAKYYPHQCRYLLIYRGTLLKKQLDTGAAGAAGAIAEAAGG